MGAVNATEDVSTNVVLKSDNYDTVTTHTIDEDLNEKISTEPTKTINKDKDTSVNTESKRSENTLKTEHKSEPLKSGKTVNVNNYTELIDEMNNAVDSENEEYTINLNSGSYKAQDIVTLASGTYQPTIIINGNKQELSGTIDSTKITINNNCNIYINNLIINTLNIENSANLYFINCSLTSNQITNTGQISIINSTSKTDIQINDGTVNIENSTLGGKISVKKNKGTLIIGDNVDFDSNLEIINDGTVNTNNPDKILLYLKNIYDAHIISDTSLNKTHNFYGAITLNNCTITSTNNINYGILTLNNCTVNVGTDNTFLTNANKVYISKDTIINGKINDPNNGVIYEGAPQTHIINQATIPYYLNDYGQLKSIKDGDTLDIQGKIILNQSLIINKAVNIISSTKDGYIDLNTTSGDYFGSSRGHVFAISKEGSYTNISGIYFHNTQLWLANTHYVTLDGISAVVENQRIGSGVGATSIRENSTHITIKNSYFHTKDNEGSSTLVLAWADYCTIENNTIEGDGMVGNLLYLTTYNVNIPTNIVYNSHNKIINNKIRGPQEPAAICYGICISGYDNLISNNTISYSGSGIMFQWGSGVDGIEQETCLFGSGENIVCNNTLYGGCGISAGNIIYNNYMEGTLYVTDAKAYNNTAKILDVGEGATEITNNTILGNVRIRQADRPYSFIENNTIGGTISIPSTATNILIKGNTITDTIELDGSFNNITNNTIITDSEYTISSKMLGQNNNITGNYLVSKGKCGDATVDLRDESNIIKNNIPINTKVELVSPSEVIVNKAVSVTIQLVDANGNLIKDAQVLISSSNGNETLTLTNGTYTYNYTPVSIGEEKFTVKYDGNYILFKSTNSTTINVIAEPVTPGNKTPEDTSGDTTTPIATPTPTTTKLDEKAQEALEQKLPAKQISITAKKTTTVSKKAKKLTLKATLKVKGKKVNKRTVKFIIKGKTYKAKTNKKGVATLKLNKKQLTKILKNVKPGKKITYKIRYGKKTVKKSLKIKK